MPHTHFPTLSRCELCGVQCQLQKSHLLPNFLYKMLRGDAGSFRQASMPKKPLQAGATAKLLCYSCEQKFSVWESEMRRTFYPNEQQAKLPIKYGTWLQLFALSVSWRALSYLKYSTMNPYVALSSAAEKLLPSIPVAMHEVAEARRLEWGRALLLGKAPSALNDQHLLFLSSKTFENERPDVVGFTVCNTTSVTAVVSQMGPCCVIGIIDDKRPSGWKNTRLQSLGGKFPVTPQSIPEDFGVWLAMYFDLISKIDD